MNLYSHDKQSIKAQKSDIFSQSQGQKKVHS